MWKLVSWKIRIELARYRANRLAIAGPIVVSVLAVLTFWAARVLFGALVELSSAFADFLLLAIYGATGMFLAIAALRWGVQRLFLSSDLELMLALPIPNRRVLATKALEIVVSSPTAAALVTAMTWGYLRAHGRPGAFVLSLLSVVPLVCGAALPGVLITLLLVRTLARSHVRALLAILPALIGAATVLLGPLATGFSRVVAGELPATQLDAIADGGTPAVRAFPTAWAADIAIGIARGDVTRATRGATLCVVAIAALAVVAYIVFRATFRTAWTQMAEASGRLRRGTLAERLVPPLPSPIRGTVVKEWRTFFRDMRTIAATFFPALMFSYFAIGNARSGESMGWMFPVLFLTFLIPGVASTALMNERRNIAIVKVAPIRGIDALIAKLAAYGMPLAIVVCIGATTFGVLSHQRPIEIVLLNVFGLWILGWVMLTHLAIAGRFARFDAEKPTLPFLPSVAGVLAAGTVSGSQILLALWIAGRFGTDVGPLSHPLVGLPAVAIAGSVCMAAVFAALGAGRRLDELDAP